MRFLTTIFITVFSVSHLFAQLERKHELGVSLGAVYLSDDKIIAPGIQLEYVYNFLSKKGKELNLWTGLEYVFTPETHISFATGLGFTVYKNLGGGIGPGIVLHGDDLMFSAVFALDYEFAFKRISFGPIIEIAYIGKHSHYMAGWGIDYAF